MLRLTTTARNVAARVKNSVFSIPKAANEVPQTTIQLPNVGTGDPAMGNNLPDGASSPNLPQVSANYHARKTTDAETSESANKLRSIPNSIPGSSSNINHHHATTNNLAKPARSNWHFENHSECFEDLSLDRFKTFTIENLDPSFHWRQLQTMLAFIGRPIACTILRTELAIQATVTMGTINKANRAVELLQRIKTHEGRPLSAQLETKIKLHAIVWQGCSTSTINDVKNLFAAHSMHKQIQIQESFKDSSIVSVRVLVRTRGEANRLLETASQKLGGWHHESTTMIKHAHFRMDKTVYQQYIIISGLPHEMSTSDIRYKVLAGCNVKHVSMISHCNNKPAQAMVRMSPQECESTQLGHLKQNFQQYNLECDVIVPLLIQYLPRDIREIDVERLLLPAQPLRSPSLEPGPDDTTSARIYVPAKSAEHLIEQLDRFAYKGRPLSIQREQRPLPSYTICAPLHFETENPRIHLSQPSRHPDAMIQPDTYPRRSLSRREEDPSIHITQTNRRAEVTSPSRTVGRRENDVAIKNHLRTVLSTIRSAATTSPTRNETL